MVVRSYRRVFDIERRIYRIDRVRLNPGGVPVRGVVYFLAIVLAVLIVGRLPVLGTFAGLVPWYLRVLALPGLSAALLSVIRIEGRPFHLGGYALWRYWLGPRWFEGTRPVAGPAGRWHPREILLLPDGSDARMRRLRYTGPGAVLVTLEHEREMRAEERGTAGIGRGGRRAAVTLRAAAGARALDRGQVIALAEGVRLRVLGSGAGGAGRPPRARRRGK
jgi:hypothetical protein